jgi:hypothetical protein
MGTYDRAKRLEIYQSYMDELGVCEERKHPTKENIRWFLIDGHKNYRKVDGMLPLFYSAFALYEDERKSTTISL